MMHLVMSGTPHDQTYWSCPVIVRANIHFKNYKNENEQSYRPRHLVRYVINYVKDFRISDDYIDLIGLPELGSKEISRIEIILIVFTAFHDQWQCMERKYLGLAKIYLQRDNIKRI